MFSSISNNKDIYLS